MRYDPHHTLRRLRGRERVVVGQLGQTLDGRVATESGESLYINGSCALTHLHRLRAEADAVIVGVGTVIADDPALTVRHCEGDDPARVVIDPRGRMPEDARLLKGGAWLVRAVGCRADVPDGAEVVPVVPDAEGTLPWGGILDALAARGLGRVLIEGGPRTLSLAVAAGVVERLHVMVAPTLFGSGRPGLTLPPIPAIGDAMRPRADVSVFEDGDVLFDCDLTSERSAPFG